jgi:hypothetical protein
MGVMKRIMKCLTLLLLMGALVFSVSACQTTQTTTTIKPGVALAGDYAIDIENLGMPLVFYLRIHADSSFELSSSRLFDVDKGTGTIGHSSGTYMMIYSDSTSETPKTATFTVDNLNLVFSTNLPYGTSNITFMKVDEDDPEIIYVLTALRYYQESHWGDYVGSHTIEDIKYNYSLSLGLGGFYKIISRYSISGTAYEFIEHGQFRVNETTISLKPEGSDAFIDGTIVGVGSYQVSLKLTSSGAREVQTVAIPVDGDFTLAGIYEINAYDLGQTIILYLTITGDREFQLSYGYNSTVFIIEGVVETAGLQYRLAYSTGSILIDAIGDNLKILSNIVIQDATILYTKSDGLGGSHQLMAQNLDNRSVYGEYSVVLSADHQYLVVLELLAGNRYVITSKWTHASNDFSYVETGTFTKVGEVFTLLPLGKDPVIGSIQSDGSIQITIQPASSASRSAVHFKFLAPNFVGTYVGFKTQSAGKTKMYETTATLTLLANGTYTYLGEDTVNGPVSENGTYTVLDNVITFTIGGSSTTFIGTYANGVLSVSFKVSTMSTSRTEIKFYSRELLGEFGGQYMVGEATYDVALLLRNDATYLLTITQGENAILEESGVYKFEFTGQKILVLNSTSSSRVVTFDVEGLIFGYLVGVHFEAIRLTKVN